MEFAERLFCILKHKCTTINHISQHLVNSEAELSPKLLKPPDAFEPPSSLCTFMEFGKF